MQLAQKVGKLGNGAAFLSAQRHLRGMLIRGRLGFWLDAEDLIKMIATPEFEAIRNRYAGEGRADGWPKYFDLARWIPHNLHRVRALGLDRGLRQSILDLGCGPGYFLFIARRLGHDTLGLDIDEAPMFREMINALGLKRRIWRIQPFVPLPPLGQKFDLITAFMVCFNGHKKPGLWGVKEWQFFLDDLEQHLRPGGRICLGFNRESNGDFYSRDLDRFFAERGARMENKRLLLVPRSTSALA